MTMSMRPGELARYRRVKHIEVGGQKNCRGECKKRRSVAQYREGSDVCLQCERRQPSSVVRKVSANDLPVNSTLPVTGAVVFAPHQTKGEKA